MSTSSARLHAAGVGRLRPRARRAPACLLSARRSCASQTPRASRSCCPEPPEGRSRRPIPSVHPAAVIRTIAFTLPALRGARSQRRRSGRRAPGVSRARPGRSRSRACSAAANPEIGDEEDATGLPPGPAFRQARYCRRSRISGTEVPCLSGRDGAPGDADALAIAGQAAARRLHSSPRHQGRRRSLRAARVRDHRCVHAVLSVWLPARAPTPAA